MEEVMRTDRSFAGRLSFVPVTNLRLEKPNLFISYYSIIHCKIYHRLQKLLRLIKEKKGAAALSIIGKKEEEKDRITGMHGTSTLIFGPIKF